VNKRNVTAAGVSVLLLLQGCAQTPPGPTVQVMPPPNKPFEVFQQDDATCRGFAANQVAGQAERANQAGVGTAVLGTVLGAGLGAAVGRGYGAGIGAASGAVVGTAAGAGGTGGAQAGIQQQYDIAYVQCMYSRGNQVPGFAPAGVGMPPPPPPPRYGY